MTEESLSQQTSTSVIWMTAQKWLSRLGGFATIIVLTRILTPEDFGLAAAASTMMPLVYVLSDVGFSTYIVQVEKVEPRTLNTAFWFSVTCGLVLSVAVIGCAPLIAALLRLPEVAALLMVMTTSVLMIAVASVPTALLRRRMAFRQLAVMDLVSTILAQIVAIVAAVLGAGAWALVLQILVSQLVGTVWVWIAAHWLPGLGFSTSEFKLMGAFGINVVGSEFLVVARGWAETAIVAAGLGVRELGYLSIAQRLVTAAQDVTVSALLPVSTVAFAKVRGVGGRLRSAYLRATSISYAVATPLMLFIAVASATLVPFLFGADKTVSADVTPALALISLLNLGGTIGYGLHLGIGRPARWLAFIAVSYAVSISILAYSVQFGMMALMAAWVGTAAVEAVARWFVIGRSIDASPWQVAVPLLGVVAPATIASILGMGVMALFNGRYAFAAIACTGVVVVLVYLVALRLIRPVTYADTLAVLPGRVTRYFTWSLPKRGRGSGKAPTDPAPSEG